MTFLLPEHFHVVAGAAVVERMRSTRVTLVNESGHVRSDLLCTLQRSEFRAGIQGAEICRSHYGFSVRSDSGLNNFALLASSRSRQVDGTYEDAVRWATNWVEQDPEHRYAFTRRSDHLQRAATC